MSPLNLIRACVCPRPATEEAPPDVAVPGDGGRWEPVRGRLLDRVSPADNVNDEGINFGPGGWTALCGVGSLDSENGRSGHVSVWN